MLNRQRILLAAMEAAGGTLHRTTLVKLAFLLSEETVVGEDPTFYDFVPYRFGPFSFALYRELEALNRDGYLDVAQDSVSLRQPTSVNISVPAKIRDAIRAVVAAYSGLSNTRLLRLVYEKYPWYASKSDRQDLRPKGSLRQDSPAALAVYTIGYEGRSIDAFFSQLLSLRLAGVVDVRNNPVSRKYGFAARSMAEIGKKLGLDYHHLPELGVPPGERTDLTKPGAREALLTSYEDVTLPTQTTAIETAAELMRSAPLALLCMEADPARCHRGRLAPAVSRVAGLRVVHV